MINFLRIFLHFRRHYEWDSTALLRGAKEEKKVQSRPHLQPRTASTEDTPKTGSK